MANKSAQALIEFINASPTPYKTIDSLKSMLKNAGAKEVKLSEINKDLATCGLYYTTYGDLCLAAFIKGNDISDGIGIGAAHIDHPVLKLKPHPTKASNGIERLSVEVYGSTINHTWLDRPLKLTGRVSFLTKDGQTTFADIDSGNHTVVIPSAALHVVRDVNDNAKFSIQNELLPFFSLSGKDNDNDFISWLSVKLSEQTGNNVSREDILSFDISLVDAMPAAFSGINDEFISATGLDDLAMTFTLFRGLCETAEKKMTSSSQKPVAAIAFNHEECGSQSITGAKSAFTKAFVSSLCKAACEEVSDALIAETMEKSIIYSCDMAHATHPSYEGKSDSEHKILHGKGLVLKTSHNQSYSTSLTGSSKFIALCKRAAVPYQLYAGHSDTRTGTTIGPMLCADLGTTTVDIGIPMLAMHSAREFCASIDIEIAINFFNAFFTDKKEG